MNNKQQGMTLVELMVTVSVLAILASVAAPSLRQMMENNRLTAINNQIVSAITYTRSEAVKRSMKVAMCARQTDTTCATATDATNGTGFEDGWIIFVECGTPNDTIDTTNVCDLDGNGTAESPEPILTVDAPSGMANLTVRPDTNSAALGRVIRYLPNGKADPYNGILDIRRDGTDVYRITLQQLTGRLSSCKVGNTGC